MNAMLKKQETPCRVAGCTHEPFHNKQAELTHYHRAHTGRIKTHSQRTVKFRLSGKRTNGVDQALTKNGVADRRTKAWRDAHPRKAKPIGFMDGTGIKPPLHRRKHKKLLKKYRGLDVKEIQHGCVITGDGFSMTLSTKFIPTILHTIALAISGKQHHG